MIRPNESVRCIRGHKGAGLQEGKVYTVAVVVRQGDDHTGPCQGIILAELGYPYVWDFTRFTRISG